MIAGEQKIASLFVLRENSTTHTRVNKMQNRITLHKNINSRVIFFLLLVYVWVPVFSVYWYSIEPDEISIRRRLRMAHWINSRCCFGKILNSKSVTHILGEETCQWWHIPERSNIYWFLVCGLCTPPLLKYLADAIATFTHNNIKGEN